MNQEFWEKTLSFKLKDLESIKSALPGSYSGESVEAIFTSYEDLLHIMQDPLIQGSWCDLGAGPCHSALLYGILYPDQEAIGVEFVAERMLPAQRVKEKLGLENLKLIHADLLTCMIPKASIYFLYFPTGMVLDRILMELLVKNDDFKLVVIESHGDLLARLDLEEGLVRLKEIPLSASRHYPNAVIYGRSFLPHKTGPFSISFLQKILLIKDSDHTEWLGESFGLEWPGGDFYNLCTPPRSIYWTQVQKIMAFDEVPKEYVFWIKLRRLGELQFFTHDGRKLCGYLRKIIISPSFVLEISTGERLECGPVSIIMCGDILCYESSSGYSFLPPVHLES